MTAVGELATQQPTSAPPMCKPHPLTARAPTHPPTSCALPSCSSRSAARACSAGSSSRRRAASASSSCALAASLAPLSSSFFSFCFRCLRSSLGAAGVGEGWGCRAWWDGRRWKAGADAKPNTLPHHAPGPTRSTPRFSKAPPPPLPHHHPPTHLYLMSLRSNSRNSACTFSSSAAIAWCSPLTPLKLRQACGWCGCGHVGAVPWQRRASELRRPGPPAGKMQVLKQRQQPASPPHAPAAHAPPLVLRQHALKLLVLLLLVRQPLLQARQVGLNLGHVGLVPGCQGGGRVGGR